MKQYKNKLLTVSIAAYNIEASIERTLLSLMPEGEPDENLDIIIVDDGSSDGTAEIAQRFAGRFPETIRLISKANGGYGSTVNAAVEAASGKYFKLLDGDDAFDADGLAGLIEFLKSSDTDLIVSPFVYERKTVSGDVSSEPEDRHTGLQEEPVCLEDAVIHDGLMMFEVCVRTDVLRKSGVRLTEHCFYTDNEYIMTTELYSSDVVRYPFPVYRYTLGEEGQSMSVAGRRKHYQDKINAAHGVFDIYETYVKNISSVLNGTRKLLAEKTISTMTREVFVSLMIMDSPMSYRKILKEFDDDLKTNSPDIYDISSQSVLVEKTRKAPGIVYRALAAKILHDEKKRTGASESTLLRNAEYIAAACMIIQCRTIYMHIEDLGMYVNRGTWLVMMAALAVCVLFRRDGKADLKCDRRTMIITACFAVYACIFLLVNPVNRLRVIRCAGAVIFMMLVAHSGEGRDKTRDILKAFSNIMVLIAGVSLFCWIFGSTLHILPGTGFVNLDWSPTGEFVRRPTFIHIYYETQWTGWTTIPARNSGIFVEAPMAGFCYSIALLIDYLLRDDRSRTVHRKGYLYGLSIWRTGLLALTIITTFSAINTLFIFVMGIVLFAENYLHVRNLSVVQKVILSVIAVAAFIFLAVMIYNKIVWGSGSTRFNDFAVGIEAWLHHPFFGGGFESLEYLQEFMPEWRFGYDIGFSNSPTEILAQGGIYLGSLYIYAFISGFVKAIRLRDHVAIISIALFAYLFVFTVVPYQYITFFMLIMISNGHIFCEKGCRDER